MDNKNDKIPILAVVGPTASGKTALAIKLAQEFNGEIISGDSMQVYKNMDIGTAKPTIEEQAMAKHHLIDFIDPDKSFSVADYVNLAHDCIKDIIIRNKIPIIAGGTGLYINSLIDNIKFTETESSPELREQLRDRIEKEGTQSLLDELRQFDPDSADTLHPNNKGRIIRAIEIYRLTGITMTEHIKRSKLEGSPYNSCLIGLNFKNRQNLYDKINFRVDKMIEQGLIKEAEYVLKNIKSPTAMQAIGYKEFIPYFNGDITLDQAIDNLKMNTRRYAKRQLSWFHRDDRINWLYWEDYKTDDELILHAENIAAEFLKN